MRFLIKRWITVLRPCCIHSHLYFHLPIFVFINVLISRFQILNCRSTLMMIRYTPIIAFLFISFSVSAQQKITGLVEDDETGSPVSYASVTSEKGGGIMTDSAGNFSLVIRKSRVNDSILVTATGYSPKKVAIKDLVRNNTITLTQKDG